MPRGAMQFSRGISLKDPESRPELVQNTPETTEHSRGIPTQVTGVCPDVAKKNSPNHPIFG